MTKNKFDGVYQTSTEGNYQMLIDIKDEHHLNYIKSIKKYDSNEEICTFESNCEELKGLEFVLKTHIVLPPSKTKCKTTNIYRKRKFLSNNFTRVMDDDLFNVLKTAYERYIEQKQIKSSNKQNINKTKTFIENTQEELIYLTSTEIAKIEKMCNIIDHKYIDTYLDWFQLIYSLKSYNLKEIAINLSKRSTKFEDSNNQFDRLWHNKNVDSIGKIFYYARMSNEERYYEIIDEFQQNKNKNLLLDLYNRHNFKKYVNYIEKESQFVDWELLKDGRIVFIDSAMGTGKTFAIKEYIKYTQHQLNENYKNWKIQDDKYKSYVIRNQNHKHITNKLEKYFDVSEPTQLVPVEKPKTKYRILAISSRKSFASFICQELDISNYIECEAPYVENKICVQLESISKLNDYEYDLVLLDEIESILKQFSSTTMMGLYEETFDSLDYILKHANKIICADAFISLRSIEFMNNYSEYFNKNNKENQLIKYIHNPIKKEQYNVSVIQYNKHGMQKAIEHILRLLEEGKNVYAPSSMKSFVINLENNIPKEMEKSCKFYHADTDKKQDAIDIKNANDLWLTKQLLSVSPTMTNGISFSPKDEFNNDIIHFDNTVQFVSNTSCCSRDLFQQLLRVRHLKSKHIYLC